MAREFRTIGVVGLGLMGAGIAEVFARNGFDVVGVEQDDDRLHSGRANVQRSTDRARSRGRLSTTQHQSLVDHLTWSTTMEDLKDCDLVIEAVVERLDLKQRIFQQLDGVVAADAVLATNTSSLSVTEIASATSRPERVVGMHFFNPAPVQRLVEVVHTVVTDSDAVSDVVGLARQLEKVPVAVRDRAGFIANALLFGYLNQAVSMYDSRLASREDIDAAVRLGCGYPLGPLQLLDLIGLDTAHAILTSMYRQSRSRRHAPAALLGQLVTAGWLGRKSGRGFYPYPALAQPPGDDVVNTGDAGQPPPQRPPQQVVVVGSSELAAALSERTSAAGRELVRLRDRLVDDDLSALAEADLVVEALTGEHRDRIDLFERLGRSCGPGTVLATTSSSSGLLALAKAAGRLDDVVGLHVRPTPHTWLVEVVSTLGTTPEAASLARAFCVEIDVQPVSCRDRAGGIVDALLLPYLNDAVQMLDAQYATAADIDTAMRDGCALPSGPFEVLDRLGLDDALAIQRTLFEEQREPALAPAPLLEHLVLTGRLGTATGRGFHDYNGDTT